MNSPHVYPVYTSEAFIVRGGALYASYLYEKWRVQQATEREMVNQYNTVVFLYRVYTTGSTPEDQDVQKIMMKNIEKKNEL